MSTDESSARYDEQSAWNAEYLVGAANAHTERVTEALRTVLGYGRGRCIDVGCGTGAQVAPLRVLAWETESVRASECTIERWRMGSTQFRRLA